MAGPQRKWRSSFLGPRDARGAPAAADIVATNHVTDPDTELVRAHPKLPTLSMSCQVTLTPGDECTERDWESDLASNVGGLLSDVVWAPCPVSGAQRACTRTLLLKEALQMPAVAHAKITAASEEPTSALTAFSSHVVTTTGADRIAGHV